jgi:hypothetical protein
VAGGKSASTFETSIAMIDGGNDGPTTGPTTTVGPTATEGRS